MRDDFIVSIVCVDDNFGSQSCFAVASSQFGKVGNNVNHIIWCITCALCM